MHEVCDLTHKLHEDAQIETRAGRVNYSDYVNSFTILGHSMEYFKTLLLEAHTINAGPYLS